MRYIYIYFTDPNGTANEIDKYINNRRVIFKKYSPVQVPLDDGIRMIRTGLFKSINENDLPKHYEQYGDAFTSGSRILVIRDEGIGDVILTTPTIHALRQARKNCTITYATNPAYELLLKHNPDIDNVVSIKNYNPKIYDEVIDLRYCSEKSPIRNTHHRIFTYAHKINLAIKQGEETPILNIPQEVIDRAKTLIGYSPKNKYVILQLGATHYCRIWEQEKFIILANKLRDAGYKVILVDKEKRNIPIQGVFDFTGQTTFEDMVGLIAVSDLTVCSDTGGYHIAGALGKAFVAMFGIITPAFRTAYYKCWHADVIPEGMECLGCGDFHMSKCTVTGTEVAKCMEKITIDQVYNASIKFLRDEYKRVDVVGVTEKKPEAPAIQKKITKFTLALICQDEEKYLKRLIPNCFGHPGIKRIVAIDGGSKDDSVGVLKRAGAEVYVHPWNREYHDQVALQRNIMASYIPEEERFIYVDPDELFSKELLARLNEIMGMPSRFICLSRRTFKSYAGALNYYNNLDASEQHLHYPDFQPRVYTNDRFLKFFRSPHHLTLNIGKETTILGADILHYERDEEEKNVARDKQWNDLVEKGRRLGLESWYTNHQSNRNERG